MTTASAAFAQMERVARPDDCWSVDSKVTLPKWGAHVRSPARQLAATAPTQELLSYLYQCGNVAGKRIRGFPPIRPSDVESLGGI